MGSQGSGRDKAKEEVGVPGGSTALPDCAAGYVGPTVSLLVLRTRGPHGFTASVRCCFNFIGFSKDWIP